MRAPGCSSIGLWTLFVIFGLFVIAYANIDNDDDEWNYDPTTKRMRKPTEVFFAKCFLKEIKLLTRSSNLVFMFQSQQVTQICQSREKSSAQTPVNRQSVPMSLIA